MLIAVKSIVEVNKLKVLLSREFDIKDLGIAKKILGMEIRKDRDAKRLWLSQAGYVKKVLETGTDLESLMGGPRYKFKIYKSNV